MAHKCTYVDRIEYDETKKQFCRIITAKGIDCYHQERELDVIKEYEDGTYYAKNICFNYIGGYYVWFPGEKDKINKRLFEDEEFSEWWFKCEVWIGDSTLNKDYIVRHDPSLKYLMKKYNGRRNDTLIKLIGVYRNHPEIEPLIELGQYAIALDKRLYKLTKEKRKQVINFIKANPINNKFIYRSQGMKLTEIFSCLKNGINYELYNDYRSCNGNVELFEYLKKQKQPHSFYVDYLKMAKRAGHNIEDKYWKYPKSLVEAHDKVLYECDCLKSAADVILKNQFLIVAENLKKQEQFINGYYFYIVQDYQDLSNQANDLHQCLLTGGYHEKFIRQESVLIFIKDSNHQPVGTIEIDYKKKILQAYGNELDRRNCKIPFEILEDAKKYIEQLNLRKRKFKYTLPEKCFIKRKDEFETGKIYQADSNESFDFYKKPDKAWLSNPDSYMIVEALGPIIKNGEKYSANKIKIQRQMNQKDVALSFLANSEIISGLKL